MKRVHVSSSPVVRRRSLLAAGAFYLGRRTSATAATPAAAPASAASAGERKVLYWHDPMVPGPALRQAGQVAVHGHAAACRSMPTRRATPA